MILGITISRCTADGEVVFLNTAHDLAKYGFMQRGPLKEACLFISRTVTPRIAPGSREVIEHEGRGAFVMRWTDSLCVTMVADLRYPKRGGVHKIQARHSCVSVVGGTSR
eukprot:Selendium_serpulae@DN3328_c0_g1_i2.p2